MAIRKMKHVLENIFNFNMGSFLKCCDCMHITNYFFNKPSYRLARQSFIITRILIYEGSGGSIKPTLTEGAGHKSRVNNNIYFSNRGNSSIIYNSIYSTDFY